MSKQKKEEADGNMSEVQPQFTDKAFGITFNDLRKKFQLVEIRYNAEGEIGQYKVLEESEFPAVVQSSFRISVGRDVFMKTQGVK